MGRGVERRAGRRGQERLHLRHYDVKLLNFFLTSAPAPAPTDGVAGAAAGVSGLSLCEEEEAEGGDAEEAEARAEARAFWAQPGRAWVVKLADYGTCDIDPGSMAEPMTERHVTTWENVLPDLLLWGASARQGFDADVWGVALCFFHLLTGPSRVGPSRHAPAARPDA